MLPLCSGLSMDLGLRAPAADERLASSVDTRPDDAPEGTVVRLHDDSEAGVAGRLDAVPVVADDDAVAGVAVRLDGKTVVTARRLDGAVAGVVSRFDDPGAGVVGEDLMDSSLARTAARMALKFRPRVTEGKSRLAGVSAAGGGSWEPPSGLLGVALPTPSALSIRSVGLLPKYRRRGNRH